MKKILYGAANVADEAHALAYGTDGNVYTVISVAAPIISVAETDDTQISRFIAVPTVFKQRLELYFSADLKPPLHIHIYNSQGALVFEKSLVAVNKKLILDDADIGKLNAGVYYLSLETGNKNLGKVKLIKR